MLDLVNSPDEVAVEGDECVSLRANVVPLVVSSNLGA
jgi:hypothetical protein